MYNDSLKNEDPNFKIVSLETSDFNNYLCEQMPKIEIYYITDDR